MKFYLNYSSAPVCVVYNYVFNCCMNPNHYTTTGLLWPNWQLMMMMKLLRKLTKTYTYRTVPAVNLVCDFHVFQVPDNTHQEIMSWNKQHLCNEVVTEVSAFLFCFLFIFFLFFIYRGECYRLHKSIWNQSFKHPMLWITTCRQGTWCKLLAANQFLILFICRIKWKLNHKRWRLSTTLCLIATELFKLLQWY